MAPQPAGCERVAGDALGVLATLARPTLMATAADGQDSRPSAANNDSGDGDGDGLGDACA